MKVGQYTGVKLIMEGGKYTGGQSNIGGREVYRESKKKWSMSSIKGVKQVMGGGLFTGVQSNNGGKEVYRVSNI